MDERARIRARLDQRKEVLLRHFASVYRLLDAGGLDGSEPGREWLEKYCVGVGVQLCPGDFALGTSLGIDMDSTKLACDVWASIDQFTGDLPPLDYVVTNYLDYFPNTIGVLKEWAGKLRPGGVMAIVCRDTEAYQSVIGPLKNERRQHCFTFRTLSAYLARAGLTVKDWELSSQQEVRVAAMKPSDSKVKTILPVT